jgi:hypothetical protein
LGGVGVFDVALCGGLDAKWTMSALSFRDQTANGRRDQCQWSRVATKHGAVITGRSRNVCGHVTNTHLAEKSSDIKTRNIFEDGEYVVCLYSARVTSTGDIRTAYIGRSILSAGRSMRERMIMTSLSRRHIVIED